MKQAFYFVFILWLPSWLCAQNTVLTSTPIAYTATSYYNKLQYGSAYLRPTLTVDATPNPSLFNEVAGSRNRYVQLRVTGLNSITTKVHNKRFRVKAFVDIYFTTTPAVDTIKNVELTIDHRPEAGTTFRETDIYKVIVPSGVSNSNVMYINLKNIQVYKWINATDSVVVTAYNDPDFSGPANNLLSWELNAWTELERYPILNQTVAIAPSSITPAYTDVNEITTEPFNISWTALPGATGYEVEWTYVDNYRDNNNGADIMTVTEIPSNQLYYDFKKSSTRVIIPATSTSYSLRSVYERGYILFRVRGVGRNPADLSKPYYSPWSEPTNSGLVSSFARRYRIGTSIVNEGDKINYQVVTNFIEQNKQNTTVTYFDGMMRKRQTVTWSNQDGKITVQDQLYDYDGRPAVQMMPSPIGPISVANKLKFYPNLNGTAAAPYTRANFEAFNTTTCSIEPQAIVNNNASFTPQGPGQYFSPNSVDLMATGNGYTPQAFGFPFTQVEYTKDNTGRINRQSGAGRDHKLGSGHETKYYYGTPSQTELDRMFGSEVGEAVHYKKNLVIDPNGQASVSYLDLKGNVVATALAGAAPTTLDNISVAATALRDTLTDFTTIDSINHILSVQKNFIVAETAVDSFVYVLTPQTFAAINNCNQAAICMDCVYDIKIKITKDDVCASCPAAVIWSDSRTVGYDANGNVDLACSSITNTVLRSGPKTLTPGSYTITKTLKVNDAAADAYINAYMANMTENCTLFTTMLTQERMKMDTFNCNIYCDSCQTQLNAYQLNNSQANFLALLNCVNSGKCDAPPPNQCEIALQSIMDDVSPGGQYCAFTLQGDDIYTASAENLSILNTTTTNKFPNITIGTFTAARTWTHGGLDYRDENNQPIQVNINGTLKSVNSLTLQEFIDNFDPVWARTLAKLHPEYCQYEWCINSANIAYNNNRDLGRTTTYAGANTSGYLSMPSAAGDPSIYNDAARWNTFVAAFRKYYESKTTPDLYPLNANQTWTFGVVGNKVNDAAFINTTLKRLAAVATRLAITPGACSITNAATFSSCYTGQVFGSGVDTVINRQWEVFRALYITLKAEVLYKEGVAHAINNNCYNGCIGANPFYSAQNGFTNDFNTQSQEPCYNTTYTFYQNKRKVFASVNDIEALSTSNNNIYESANPLALFYVQGTNAPGPLRTQVSAVITDLCPVLNLGPGKPVSESASLVTEPCVTLTDTLQTGAPAPDISVVNSTSGQNCQTCNESNGPKTRMHNPCGEYLYTVATQNARNRYQAYKDSLALVLRNLYYAKCLKASERFVAYYNDRLYHFTLYYYDQANNLVKTIPPHGFNNILFSGSADANTKLDNIRKDRANNRFPKPLVNNTLLVYYPAHTIPTYYQYNSLNQIVHQWSTDGGGTRMVYDEMRRLVRSHNAHQGTRRFSYTKYDYLNRVVEVGECKYTTDKDTLATSTTYAAHTTLVAGGLLSQITRTRYDDTYHSSINAYFGSAGQENLRGRIATVMYSPSNALSLNGVPTFEQATHYSYDIQGNVKILIQDHSTFGQKRLDYNYELISGNVNSVTYQKGRWDQFIHYYSYDLDNRLRWVETSQFPTAIPATSSGMREQEAQYFYYRHGPLRRIELGTLKVQGMDYAYTIQGWIKGVNSGELKHQFNDMGQDGRPGTTNAPVARDAFGYVLGYYSGGGQNDYHPISTTAPVFDRDGYTVGTAAALYNGNIAKMTTATRDNDNTTTPGIRSQRMQYRYDQLQRIKKQDAFDRNGTTYASTTAYAMTLTYDAGGNIKTMTRNGDASLLNMDNLNYEYYNAVGKPNQLKRITDTYTTASLVDDLETQVLDTNYRYDKIGNMTRDYSEGGKFVTWNVYNKITNVSMSSGTKTLDFGYDAAGNRVRKESTASGVTTKQWYVRDAQGNIMSTYKQVGTGTLKQEYVYLYGSTRVGEYLLNRDSATAWNRHYYRVKGNRHYELTNHLGNVLAVVTDRKMAKDTTADATYTPQFFMPDVYSVQNYYAFGQSMPNWSSTAAVNDPKKYRFGYNGKEDDDEWGKQDYGARIYDGRVGRWLSTDPLQSTSPYFSSYIGMNNNPIRLSDPSGMKAEDDIFLNDEGQEISRIKNKMSDRFFLEHDKGDYEFDGKKYIQVNSVNTLVGDLKDDRRHNKYNGTSQDYHDDATATVQNAAKVFKDKKLDPVLDAASQSMEGGAMDYVSLFEDGTIYKIDGIYYNSHEALNLLWGATNELIGNNLTTALLAAHVYHAYAYASKGNRYKAAGIMNEENHNLAIRMGYSLFSPNEDNNQKPNFLPIEVQNTQRTMKDNNQRAQAYLDFYSSSSFIIKMKWFVDKSYYLEE